MRRGELWYGETQIAITEMEALILKRLSETPNQSVDRSELIGHTELEDRFSQNRAVDVRMSRLRQKIELDPRHPRYLVTVRGTGYKIITD